MRLIILSILLLFFNSIYTQEGSKIDLKNVDVATNRLPTIILFEDEYTLRDRDEFLESLIKSRFYSPDLEIVINLQEFISKRQINFNHNGPIKINIDSRKLKNQNRYNSQIQSGIYISSFLRKVKSVRIDSSLAGTLERRALKNQINLIQKQIDSLDIEIRNNNINFSIGFSEFFGSRNESELGFSKNKVNGKTFFVMDFDYATHIMVCDKDGQIGIVSLESSGIEIVDLITVDKTRVFKEIIFKNTEVDILENTSSSKDAVDNAIDAGRIVIAADSLGASKAMLDKAIDYSKERKQFNRAIGSFQAVKHMCAEMASELEPCYSILWHAAHSFDSKEKNKKIMACHAKSHISDISKLVSKKATEVHGGMGFTDLLGLHYWFKRIGVNRQMLGSPEIVREEAAKSQGL